LHVSCPSISAPSSHQLEEEDPDRPPEYRATPRWPAAAHSDGVSRSHPQSSQRRRRRRPRRHFTTTFCGRYSFPRLLSSCIFFPS
jgi:hypothetical protein